MLHTRFYRFSLVSLLLITNTILPFAQNFTEEDRARMIRTETRLEAVEKRMEEGFTQMDKRFDRVELLLDRLYEKLDSKVDK
jgi:Skp family chaperone for outer membrane proteins